MQPLIQKRVVLPNAMSGSKPTEVYLMSDGTLLFTPPFDFKPTYEDHPSGVSSWFGLDGFTLWEPGSKMYNYEYETPYRYKEMPLMRGWLVQQDLDKSQL